MVGGLISGVIVRGTTRGLPPPTPVVTATYCLPLAENVTDRQAIYLRERVEDFPGLDVRELTFDLDIANSSWVAVRILPSVHTNPIFIEVGGKPIHASRKSAEWCVQAVDTCWKSKENGIRESERAAAKAAYDQAREIYQKIATTAVAD